MKQIIILFGAPGSGKGTQANLLSEKFGFFHFETSKILEKCFKTESPEKIYKADGQEFKIKDEIKRWETGLLNSPPFVVSLVVKKIKELAKSGESIVFSASPRTIYEAKKEVPLFKKLYGEKNIRFIILEVNPETTIYRNSHRKICELMRHGILFNQETENLKKCPIDGSNLVSRYNLDDVETIKKRLSVFTSETYPVIEAIQKQGIVAHKIDGQQSIADVHSEILKILDK